MGLHHKSAYALFGLPEKVPEQARTVHGSELLTAEEKYWLDLFESQIYVGIKIREEFGY